MSSIVRESNVDSPEREKVKIRYPDYKYKEKLCESEIKGGEYLGETDETVSDGTV
jgi:hypothetical protein